MRSYVNILVRWGGLKAGLAALALLSASVAQGAWYWPFDNDSTNKPPRLHRLLTKANDYIEIAEDESLMGNGDKAIENYRLALDELNRVERENPDRADTPEFAPLRTKRATCQSAIDTIRFAQVNDNERAVQVTDTKELQKKWNKKHGIKTPEDEEEERQAKEKAAKEAQQRNALDGVTRSALSEVLALLKANDLEGASKKLEAVEKTKGDDVTVLLLRSGIQVAKGHDFAARRTLERAIKLHPNDYLPLYNLANLALKIDDDQETARRYYEKGRKLGGPENAALERLVKK